MRSMRIAAVTPDAPHEDCINIIPELHAEKRSSSSSLQVFNTIINAAPQQSNTIKGAPSSQHMESLRSPGIHEGTSQEVGSQALSHPPQRPSSSYIPSSHGYTTRRAYIRYLMPQFEPIIVDESRVLARALHLQIVTQYYRPNVILRSSLIFISLVLYAMAFVYQLEHIAIISLCLIFGTLFQILLGLRLDVLDLMIHSFYSIFMVFNLMAFWVCLLYVFQASVTWLISLSLFFLGALAPLVDALPMLRRKRIARHYFFLATLYMFLCVASAGEMLPIEEGQKSVLGITSDIRNEMMIYAGNGAVFLYSYAFMVLRKPAHLHMVHANMRSIKSRVDELHRLRSHLKILFPRLKQRQGDVVNHDETLDSMVLVLYSPMLPFSVVSRDTIMKNVCGGYLSKIAFGVHKYVPMLPGVGSLMVIVCHTLVMCVLQGRINDDLLPFVSFCIILCNIFLLFFVFGLCSRNVLSCMIHQFEPVLLMGLLICLTIISCWLFPLKYCLVMLFNMPSLFTGICSDALPSFASKGLRRTAAIVVSLYYLCGLHYGIHSERFVFRPDTSSQTLLVINFGGDSLIISSSEVSGGILWTIIIFHIKYLYHSYARPNCCVLLRGSLAYARMTMQEYEALRAVYNRLVLNLDLAAKEATQILDDAIRSNGENFSTAD